LEDRGQPNQKADFWQFPVMETGIQNLCRERAPVHLLPTRQSRVELHQPLIDELTELALSTPDLAERTIAFDLDDTILCRRNRSPEAWVEQDIVTPEFRFDKMIPSPRNLGRWIAGPRDRRELYSPKRYPFLKTPTEPTQIRTGMLELLKVLSEQCASLVLITATDRYRLDYLNRLLPELKCFFGSRQLCLEQLLADKAERSPYEKLPEDCQAIDCVPYDYLVDDSPKTRELLEQKQISDKLIAVDAEDSHVEMLRGIAQALFGVTPQPAAFPASPALSFDDPSYLSADPEIIAAERRGHGESSAHKL